MTLSYLNDLRAKSGMKPLKAWKESKAKLADAISSLEAKLNQGRTAANLGDYFEESTARKSLRDNPDRSNDAYPPPYSTTVLPDGLGGGITPRDSAEEAYLMKNAKPRKQSKVDDAVKNKIAKDAKEAQRTGAHRGQTSTDHITLVQIAKELGIDPKVARAKMRRVKAASDMEVSKHTYALKNKQWVVDALKADFRKVAKK